MCTATASNSTFLLGCSAPLELRASDAEPTRTHVQRHEKPTTKKCAHYPLYSDHLRANMLFSMLEDKTLARTLHKGLG